LGAPARFFGKIASVHRGQADVRKQQINGLKPPDRRALRRMIMTRFNA